MELFGPTVSGPAFLLFYALVAVLVIVVAKRSLGPDPAVPPPLIDPNRDPFEIAFLRGGDRELVRFATFELVRVQALRFVTKGKSKTPNAVQATGFAAGVGPAELFAAILTFCAEPRTTDEILGSPLPALAASHAEQNYRPQLVSERLLTPEDRQDRARRARLVGLAILALLAGVRLAAAFALHHRNIGFLIIEAVASCIVLVVVIRTRRLSARGRAYLDRLKAMLAPMRGGFGSATAATAALPIFVAATGFSALANTPYAPMNQMFARSASGGDCGGDAGGSSGDSGGSCGGSGCGGGCGG